MCIRDGVNANLVVNHWYKGNRSIHSPLHYFIQIAADYIRG